MYIKGRKKTYIFCLGLTLLLLVIVVCVPKPIWWIAQRDLCLPVALNKATIEAKYYVEHAPNGDGVDIVKLTVDEQTWKRLTDNLNNELWREWPIPMSIQGNIIGDCECVIWDSDDFEENVLGGDQILEMYDIMQEKDTLWFYKNRYTIRHQNGENLIQPSTNYTFGLLYPKTKSIFYIRSDS